ncbi:MAG: hypothetical protein ACE5F1_21470, partial [Planctomycetota bacterium]
MKALLLASLLLQEAPTGFRSAWPEGITRSWVGPEFWANRLQDWRIHRGWLECLESSATRPMRVVHLLSRSAGEQAGKLELRVLCTPLRDGGGSFCGFLLGAGGSHVDYRLTALVHHRPAQDGGLVAALDGGGRLVFRDNEKNVAKGGWAITGKLREGELLEVPASSRQGTRVPGTLGAVELRLAARPRGQDYRLVLSVHVPESGGELARAVLDDVDPELVAGSLALVAHRGKARFRDFRASGGKLRSWPERSFGPVLAAQYSLSRGTLKLTAQMPPLGESDTQRAEFQLLDGGSWRTVAGSRLVVPGYTFPFRVEDFDATRAWKYRVAYRLRQSVGEKLTSFEGTIRKEPVGKRRFVLAAFTGNKHFTGGIRWNHDGVWFPHRELVRAVRYHDPDLLFFSGDQIYEGDLTGAQRR